MTCFKASLGYGYSQNDRPTPGAQNAGSSGEVQTEKLLESSGSGHILWPTMLTGQQRWETGH